MNAMGKNQIGLEQAQIGSKKQIARFFIVKFPTVTPNFAQIGTIAI
jgi:hypothetical protein